jgi:hypothetical protein
MVESIIVRIDGEAGVGTGCDGSHNLERFNAFGQCRNTSSIETSMPAFGALPWSSSAARGFGSSTTRVLPFTRKVFLGAGDEEDEAYVRVGDNVLDRVEVIVAPVDRD